MHLNNTNFDSEFNDDILNNNMAGDDGEYADLYVEGDEGDDGDAKQKLFELAKNSFQYSLLDNNSKDKYLSI